MSGVGILTRCAVKTRDDGRERQSQEGRAVTDVIGLWWGFVRLSADAPQGRHPRHPLCSHTGVRSLRRESGRVGAGMSLVGTHQRHVRHHVSVKDWFRRLGWLGLWLVARRSMRLWLAVPTLTGSRAVILSRRNGRLVEEPSVGVGTVADDTTRSACRSCAQGNS